MARFFAQLATPVFLVVTVVGLIAGDASRVTNGHAGGNVGDLVLHMTWIRDALDAILLAAFVWIGFVASRRAGRLAMIALGVVLLALAVSGFLVGDNDYAGKGYAGLHFPVAINVFDLIMGVLALLSGLGTVEDPAPARAAR